MRPSMFCMRLGQWMGEGGGGGGVDHIIKLEIQGTIKRITLLINLNQAFLRGQISVSQATINRCTNRQQLDPKAFP